ncbi:hypothetical protein L495_0369 [Bordetella bronchiseptica CARE970018BB]|nr:hypothetical protein L495_0369 [Bordetella bronchiseptica CARE970018BB]
MFPGYVRISGDASGAALAFVEHVQCCCRDRVGACSLIYFP